MLYNRIIANCTYHILISYHLLELLNKPNSQRKMLERSQGHISVLLSFSVTLNS